jgi:hypothetical protein
MITYRQENLTRESILPELAHGFLTLALDDLGVVVFYLRGVRDDVAAINQDAPAAFPKAFF